MKKSVLLIPAVIVFLFACSKEKDQGNSAERGTITKKVFLGTLTKNEIIVAVSPYLSDLVLATIKNHDVDYYRINYRTIDPEGIPTIASGLVVFPKNTTGPIPILSYQHGTTLHKSDVASYMKGEFEVCLLLGMKGYVVSCPDYLGLGDGTGLHPYLHTESEATAVVDMLRASRNLCRDINFSINEQAFLMGYSQGGHATMAALKMIEEQYGSEFNVTACSAMAGPYDLSGTTLKFVMRETEFPAPGYLPYLLFAYNKQYNMYEDLSNVFVSPYYDEFKEYFNDNPAFDLDVVNDLWPSSKIPSVVLKPEIVTSINENPNDPLKLALEENNLYDWAPESPLLLCHCDSDAHVPYQNSEMAYNSFIQHGSTNVTLVSPFRKGTHITCAVPSFIYTLVWFNSMKQ